MHFVLNLWNLVCILLLNTSLIWDSPIRICRCGQRLPIESTNYTFFIRKKVNRWWKVDLCWHFKKVQKSIFFIVIHILRIILSETKIPSPDLKIITFCSILSSFLSPDVISSFSLTVLYFGNIFLTSNAIVMWKRFSSIEKRLIMFSDCTILFFDCFHRWSP